MINHGFHGKDNSIRYESRTAKDLSEQEVRACSELYSRSYGRYVKNSPYHPGQQIKMGIGQYKKRYYVGVRPQRGERRVYF